MRASTHTYTSTITNTDKKTYYLYALPLETCTEAGLRNQTTSCSSLFRSCLRHFSVLWSLDAATDKVQFTAFSRLCSRHSTQIVQHTATVHITDTHLHICLSLQEPTLNAEANTDA